MKKNYQLLSVELQVHDDFQPNKQTINISKHICFKQYRVNHTLTFNRCGAALAAGAVLADDA